MTIQELTKIIIETIDETEEDIQHYQRQNVGSIEANPFGEGDTLTGICLCNKVIPAPTVTAGAEAEVNQTA